MDVNGIEQIEVPQVADFLARGVPLIDVREPHEWEADRIPGAILRPLSQLPAWQDEFAGKEVLFSCRSGQRSQQVAQHLSQVKGRNLIGGILAYRTMFPEDA